MIPLLPILTEMFHVAMMDTTPGRKGGICRQDIVIILFCREPFTKIAWLYFGQQFIEGSGDEKRSRVALSQSRDENSRRWS